MNLLNRFKDTRVLVIGDVMLDQYWWGGVSRISPEAPVPIVHLQETTSVPGGAANVAVNIAALGATPILMGSVGQDTEADKLYTALIEKSVSADHLVKYENRATCVKTRIIAQGQQIVRIDREDTDLLDEADSQRLVENLGDLLRDIDLVIVSDYSKGCLTEHVLQQVFSEGIRFDKPVLVDPKGKDFSKYHGAFMLTPNRREAADACKLDETHENMTNVAGDHLLEIFGFDNVLITESEKGMTLFRLDSAPLHFDAIAHEVFDVTGAGDTVIATLGVALAAGLDVAKAVETANIAAGIAVGQIGTSAVTIDHLTNKIGGQVSGVSRR